MGKKWMWTVQIEDATIPRQVPCEAEHSRYGLVYSLAYDLVY